MILIKNMYVNFVISLKNLKIMKMILKNGDYNASSSSISNTNNGAYNVFRKQLVENLCISCKSNKLVKNIYYYNNA